MKSERRKWEREGKEKEKARGNGRRGGEKIQHHIQSVIVTILLNFCLAVPPKVWELKSTQKSSEFILLLLTFLQGKYSERQREGEEERERGRRDRKFFLGKDTFAILKNFGNILVVTYSPKEICSLLNHSLHSPLSLSSFSFSLPLFTHSPHSPSLSLSSLTLENQMY